MSEDIKDYLIILLKTIPSGIIGAILVALFQRWWKTTGKIDARVELKSLTYFGKQNTRGAYQHCEPAEALFVECRLRLFVSSYKEAPTALHDIAITFRKGKSDMLHLTPKNPGDANKEVRLLELPSRKPIEMTLTAYTNEGSPDVKQVVDSDSLYLTAVDLEGKKWEYFISAINRPNPPTPDKAK